MIHYARVSNGIGTESKNQITNERFLIKVIMPVFRLDYTKIRITAFQLKHSNRVVKTVYLKSPGNNYG